MKFRSTFLPTAINWFLRWSQKAFLIIGVLALSYVSYALLDAWLYQADQTRQFEQALKGANLVRAEGIGVAGHKGSPLGRIEIGQIGLAAMILEGTSEDTLQRAVGHIEGTPLPGQNGNVAIAGHRDTFFRELRNIHLGDEITMTTLSGSKHYRVYATKVVEPEQIEVLNDEGDNMLTLVTCYPFNFIGFAPQRFIVQARKILD